MAEEIRQAATLRQAAEARAAELARQAEIAKPKEPELARKAELAPIPVAAPLSPRPPAQSKPPKFIATRNEVELVISNRKKRGNPNLKSPFTPEEIAYLRRRRLSKQPPPAKPSGPSS